MKMEKGVWKISTGKNGRIYIHCNNKNIISHPQDLCENNGLLIYEYQSLKDLAIAILLYEKEKQKSESILNEVENKEKE